MRRSVQSALLLRQCWGPAAAPAAAAAGAGAQGASAAGAAAGLATSSSVQGAAVTAPSKQPSTALLGAVFPNRGLLIKKLRRSLGLGQQQLQQQHEAAKRRQAQRCQAKAEERTARAEAARAWLAGVVEAAQGQRVADVVAMLEGHDRLWQQQQRLPPQKQRQPQQDGAGRPGLLGHAALLAARCLADPRHGGSARHAQAFVELLVERRALAPRQARSAVHAVLQAFDRDGDLAQTLAAAARVYDTGDASSTCLMPGERPPPSTLALLLAACGRAGRGDLLMGVWRHLGPQRRQGADGAADAADGQGGPGSSAAAGRPPSRRAAHALVEAAVLCDLRAAGLWGAASGSAGDSGSTGSGQRALQVPGTGAVSPARRWRHAGELGMALFGDSCLADALSELHDWLPDARQHQQPGAGGVEGRAAAGAAPGAPAPAPALLQPPLLPPDAALAVLRGCGSVDDVDALLLSQLLHPSNGLSLREMRRMLRARAAEHGPGARPGRGGGRAGEEAAAAAAAAVYDRHPMSGLLARAMQARAGSQLQQHRGRGAPRPGAAQQAAGASAPLPPPLGPALFPPVLPPPLAAAAVAAYMRHGAVSRAAAVARAAGSSGLQDQQALQRLAADCARAGLLLPALNAAEALRSEFWRAPAPYAAAELMRCAARAAGPPLGAGCTPGALASLWRRHGVAHPVAWGALLRGLWETGDTGQSLRPALLAAMAEPLPLTGLDAGGQAGAGARAADAARSQIVGELVRAMLERDPGDRRPRAAAGVAPAPGGRRARFGEGAAAAEAGLERGGGGSVDAWLESAAPGLELWLPLPYQEQPALAARVEAVLQMLAWLRARGVSVRDDALLAAALQALRACRHGGDAHASGLLPRLSAAALALGVVPGPRTLRALLSVCNDLDARAGLGPFAFAATPSARVAGVTLEEIVAQAHAALARTNHAGSGGGSGVVPQVGHAAAAAGAAWDGRGEAERLAAAMLRALAFHTAFDGYEAGRSGVAAVGEEMTA